MLKTKKFNELKHVGINYLSDSYENYNIIYKNYFDDSDDIYDNYISIIHIKDLAEFTIEKDILLNTYLLRLHDIIVIHLDSIFIKDFEFLYKDSEEYVFDIYESTSPNLVNDTYNTIYHIFCVSKKISINFDFILFLKMNDSIKQYTYLSQLLGPVVILNRRFDIIEQYNKYNGKYKFVKRIGKGVVNNDICILINKIIKLIHIYQDMLPPHYIKLSN